MTQHIPVEHPAADSFRSSLRAVAASVFVVASRDDAGAFHGMAVTSASSLSMEPPSMMVAVNRAASVHPVIRAAGWFSLSLLTADHADLLQAFSRSDQRDRRFPPDRWAEARGGMPALAGALATHVCRVAATHDFGTHSVFFGQVEDVILPDAALPGAAPLIWFNGACLPAAAPQAG